MIKSDHTPNRALSTSSFAFITLMTLIMIFSSSFFPQELIEKRRKLLKQFEELREKLRETWLEEKENRKQLRGFVDTDELDSAAVEEEVVEFVIKEEITICE